MDTKLGIMKNDNDALRSIADGMEYILVLDTNGTFQPTNVLP